MRRRSARRGLVLSVAALALVAAPDGNGRVADPVRSPSVSVGARVSPDRGVPPPLQSPSPASMPAAPEPLLRRAPLSGSAARLAPALPRFGVPPATLVRIAAALAITSKRGGGATVGTMPARSKYLGTPTVAWVEEISEDGRFGRVTVPYTGTRQTGWIPLNGLEGTRTPYRVQIDLSRRELTVTKRGVVTFRTPAGIGRPSSPTPPGRYFVTDRAPFPPGGYYGGYVFGISGIQTRLPPGWGGGNQLAIHGTNDPGSIGRAASAGCVRVSGEALERLKPLLQLGTPVVITR